MSNDLYCVTVYDDDDYYDNVLDELLVYGYEQAKAAGEYLKLYSEHEHDCENAHVSITSCTVCNEDYVSILKEYKDELAKQKRTEYEELMREDLAHIKELIKIYEDDYGVKPEL